MNTTTTWPTDPGLHQTHWTPGQPWPSDPHLDSD